MKQDPWLIRNAERLVTILRSPGQIKHLGRHLESYQSDYLFNKPSPWLSFDVIDYLSAQIIPGWRVFEYGSGGSTLFWLTKGAEVVSVEHDADWYRQTQPRLSAFPRVDYRLVPPESGNLCESRLDAEADPHCYQSSDSRYIGMNFKRYASQIDEFPDQHFDMVIVDGRARPSCVMHSVAKVKVGGLLVLDNVDRKYYLTHVQSLVKGFTERRFSGLGPGGPIYLYTQTSIFTKRFP
ncbi:MAG: hypothetical protein IT320_05765 [Anaerolineae bacterium]|nr:hypothetical protein [Anaerolineae bacterium]